MLDQHLLPFDLLGGRSGRPVSRRRREMAMRFDESPHLLAEDIVFGPVIKIHNASNFHAGGKQEGGSPHRSVRTPLPPEDRAPGARDRNQSRAWPRSDERRVGNECVRTCRSRWSPYPAKKK